MISVLHKYILFEIRFHFQLLASSESRCGTMLEVCTYLHCKNNKNLYFEFTIAIKNILNVMRMLIIIIVDIIPHPGGATTRLCVKVL